jgi:hypothetical protein
MDDVPSRASYDGELIESSDEFVINDNHLLVFLSLGLIPLPIRRKLIIPANFVLQFFGSHTRGQIFNL